MVWPPAVPLAAMSAEASIATKRFITTYYNDRMREVDCRLSFVRRAVEFLKSDKLGSGPVKPLALAAIS